MGDSSDIEVRQSAHVAHVRWSRPPANFLDPEFMGRLADQLDALDADANCRVIVLSAEGKVFSGGANFQSRDLNGMDPAPFYQHALRLFRTKKPMVAAVQGAAIGAGMGLALVADFRVSGPSAKYSANFVRLGFHPGFALSFLLPRLIGQQHATAMLYTGRRIDAHEALRLGLIDQLAQSDEEMLEKAFSLAQEIASAAPLAVLATRETIRLGLADQIVAANRRELEIQRQHFATSDFREGIAAARDRRDPMFTGG